MSTLAGDHSVHSAQEQTSGTSLHSVHSGQGQTAPHIHGIIGSVLADLARPFPYAAQKNSSDDDLIRQMLFPADPDEEEDPEQRSELSDWSSQNQDSDAEDVAVGYLIHTVPSFRKYV